MHASSKLQEKQGNCANNVYRACAWMVALIRKLLFIPPFSNFAVYMWCMPSSPFISPWFDVIMYLVTKKLEKYSKCRVSQKMSMTIELYIKKIIGNVLREFSRVFLLSEPSAVAMHC